MDRSVKFVEMRLNLSKMKSLLLLAMNVLSLFVDHVMNMKEGRAIKLARNAKLDSSA